MPVLLDRLRVRAFDDTSAEISVASAQVNKLILSFRTPPGLKGYITSFGQAWDANLNTFAKYTLKVNGGVVYPYNQLLVQTCPPEAAGQYPLPFPIPLEQLSLVEVYVDNGASVGAGNFAARVICKYYDLADVHTI